MLSVYDKLHLVPFGEYLPFQDWMEKLGFEQLTKVQGGFIPGHAPPRAGDPERAARAAADLLRGDLSRRRCRRATTVRAGSST